jgi:hypothetical protein
MNISPEALEAICRNGLEYMLMVSIISSDNIITIKDAEEAIDTINSLEKAVEASALDSEKKEWFNEKIKQGREILDGDIERFKKN